MTKSAPLLLLLLCACQVSAATDERDCPEAVDGACAAGPNSSPMSPEDLAQATASAQAHLAHIQGLPQAERDSAGASLELLAANSLLTRAAVLTPMVLEQSVSGISPDSVSAERREEWLKLQAGLQAHVATLEAMGVVLGAPVSGQHLHGLALAKTREEVLLGGQPIEDATRVCAAIPPTLPESVLKQDRWHTHQVDRITGQPWTLNPQLAAWHQALNSLEPAMTRPQDKAQVNQLIQMMNLYFDQQGC